MIGVILSPIVRLFGLLKSFIVYDIRVDGMILTSAYEAVMKDGKVYSTNNEFIKTGMPRQYDAYVYYKKLFFIFSIQERMLKAGNESYDIISSISIFRFQRKRLLKFLHECSSDTETSVPILLPNSWGSTKLGSVKRNKKLKDTYIEVNTHNTISDGIQSVLDDPDSQTGFLLHGPPGTGKSCIVKYFALKYNLPIYVIVLSSETSNNDIVRMFANIESPSIILFEDFDSYFSHRSTKLRGARFTLDAILNVIDGSYTNSEGKIFFITTNNIDEIDASLKCRPSRFKHVINVCNPSPEVRSHIFDGYDDNVINQTDGYTLDQCIFLRQRLDIGEDLVDAKKLTSNIEGPANMADVMSEGESEELDLLHKE